MLTQTCIFVSNLNRNEKKNPNYSNTLKSTTTFDSVFIKNPVFHHHEASFTFLQSQQTTNKIKTNLAISNNFQTFQTNTLKHFHAFSKTQWKAIPAGIIRLNYHIPTCERTCFTEKSHPHKPKQASKQVKKQYILDL